MNRFISAEELTRKRCRPCEGSSLAYTPSEVAVQLEQLPAWNLTADGKWISRKVGFKDFTRALEFINAVAALAQTEGHHPDLHLVRYREAEVALTTHSIEGLSENDFIVAAKIDQLVATEFGEAKTIR